MDEPVLEYCRAWISFTWRKSKNICHVRCNFHASAPMLCVYGNSSMVNNDIEEGVHGLLPDFVMVISDDLCFSRGQIARLSPMRFGKQQCELHEDMES